MRLRHTFVRLPLEIDADALRTEIDGVPGSAWRAHPEGAPGNSAVVLVGVGGDPTGDSTLGPMAATPHLERLPYVARILAALGTTIGRTRLMRIATETELEAHVDTNYYWWNHLRLHVPVTTTPDVVFQAGDDSVHMAAGEAWVFDTWRRHRVDNPADRPRVHLVIDIVGSAALWQLIDGSGQPPRRIDPATADDAPSTFPLETWNWPVVMSPAEVDTTIGALVDEMRLVDPAVGERAERCLGPFRHDWHDLTARFGPSADGWPARRALLDTTMQAIGRELDGAVLPNGVVLTHALHQLVLGPALSPHAAHPPVVRPPVVRPPVASRAGTPPAAPLLAGPPRIVDPVFLVCPPRSGSSLLFETLQRSPTLATIGGESHEVFEGIASLTPAAHDWSSNRLDGDDANDGVVAHLKERFAMRMRDRNGGPVGGPTRLLEKTPKNALRLPFLARAFPDARFVYLYRDPRETVSSMLDAWRSGRFVTYPQLPGWDGPPWSLLLTPGWRDLRGRPIGEIVSRQWTATVDVLLDDLAALDADRWCVASYDRLVTEPRAEVRRLCDFLAVDWDDDLSTPLPHSRHTLDSPHPQKWRRNADELEPHVELIATAARRARDVFAEAPRTTPARVVESVDRDPPPSPPPSSPPAGPSDPADPSTEALFGSTYTASFRALLDTAGATLVISTYQAGRLIMVRPTSEGLNSHFRALPTPMGLAYDGLHLAVGTRAEIIVFQNQPALCARLDDPELHDGCFVVRERFTTGDIRVHDLAFGDEGLWAVNTRFSCLVTLDHKHSFVPRWRPPFVTALAGDDRAHLNGMAMVDGAPGYVTVLGTSDAPGGWRERKADGGALLDVASGEVVVGGLSMPHSPRWHDGRLWVLESGRGALAVVDLASGRIERVAEVPGFARGLAFAGRYALIGLSRVREHTFDGLPLTRDRTDALQSGVWIVDTETGAIAGHLSFGGVVQEIFEVALLGGLRHPELVEPGAALAESAYVLPDDALRDVSR